MTVWRDASDIARLNAAAGDHPVAVSPETRDVLHIANQISEQTRGKFDVTFAALSGLWKFDYQDKDNRVPDPKEIARRLPLINYRDLVVDDAAGTAFLKRKGMRVNLGGIGKGYAVDRAVDIMRRSGLHDFMIQAGGDMYVSGTRALSVPIAGGEPGPARAGHRIFAALDLTDATFSTSGDYERFFMKDGRRYHHLDLSLGDLPGSAAASRSSRIARSLPTRSRKGSSSSGRMKAWRSSNARRAFLASSCRRITRCRFHRGCETG